MATADDGDAVVFGEPHRRVRVTGHRRGTRRGEPLIAPEDAGGDWAVVIPRERWEAMQAVVAAARAACDAYWVTEESWVTEEDRDDTMTELNLALFAFDRLARGEPDDADA